MKKFVLTLTLLILLSSTSFAFDGNRKGFILGGGFDYSISTGWKLDSQMDSYETGSGLGFKFLIGYGFNDKNMIVYEVNSSRFFSDTLQRKITQGFSGASWYHYFGSRGKSIFTNIGVGFLVYSIEDRWGHETDDGYQFGVGYEFSHHWQAGFYYTFGKTTDRQLRFSHQQIHFSIIGVAF